jgi:hypothetical protein
MNKSPDYGQDLNLEVPLFIDTDLEVDEHGVLNLKLFIYTDESGDSPQTLNLPFYRMTDYIVESHDEEQDYQQLYSIANELVKESERIREVAERIENSTSAVADLFNTAYVSPV